MNRGSLPGFRHIFGATTDERYYVAGNTSGLGGSRTATADQMLAVPLELPYRSRIDRIGIRVLGGAGGLARIGIYESFSGVNLLPRELVMDSGDIDVSTTGFKIATVNVTLRAGSLYWVALVTNSSTLAIRSLGPTNVYPILGWDNTLDMTVSPGMGWLCTHPYGALPAMYPDATIWSSATGVPAIGYRLAI